MVRLIMGTKGSGKTKQLIELINNAAKDEPGNVVCIEANRNLTYDIHYHIRLIDAQEYKLNSYDMFRGFISGLYAGGCDAGGLYGATYDVSICTGSAQGWAVHSGKRAAESAAAYLGSKAE